MTKKTFGLGILVGAASLVLIMLLAMITIPYTGLYNVSATRDHSSLVRWMFESTLENSVKSRADEVGAPPSFTDTMIRSGASEYKSMCQHCHGGPGIDQESWAKGMLPQPPQLTEAATHWETRELHWLVKHGIKMSGMPAFGQHHSDEAIWNIVAFVETLPGMTKEKYQSYESHHADSGSHSH